MRPVTRGASPLGNTDYTNYRDAFPALVGWLGLYCSYCERRIPTNLAVEHIQPKALPAYEALKGRWTNFLLGCVNCNSTKGDQDVVLTDVYLADRDNTFVAFDYLEDGRVVPSALADVNIANRTLELVGLDKGPNSALDANGQIVAIDRYAQRMEVWGIAKSSTDDLDSEPTPGMRRAIVKAAQAEGFFSIWMKVFEGDVAMRRMLVEGFTAAVTVNGMQTEQFFGFNGTARDCFDANFDAISPRPDNGLVAAGKI
jgi:hypothetical protein